jgi:hypothetical protein
MSNKGDELQGNRDKLASARNIDVAHVVEV